MPKIAAIGDLECVWPFKAYGADVHPAATAEEATEAVEKCMQGAVAVVFITEDAYQLAGEKVKEAELAFEPAICMLPSPGAPKQMAEELIREATRRAVGADIGG